MKETDRLRAAVTTSGPELVARLGALVAQESPPGDRPQLKACADLLEEWGTAALRRPARRVLVDGLPHLLWAATDQRVLLLGHYDTVFPAGTVDERPFTVTGTIATGPGVCDMKAGIVQMLGALELLPDVSRVGLLLTADEESGSPTSRELIEEQARRSAAVLVGEPSTEDGDLKVARKGGSAYRLTVRGRAAHAGVEPHRGVNATVEAAHQILAIGGLGNPDTSVTPTLLSAGVMSNMVPDLATVAVDVRAWSRAELERIDAELRALRPSLAGARLELSGGVNRYPLDAALNQTLLERAQYAAGQLGLPPVRGVAAPGASDANFTGALGVPTLDGLGGVGGNPHADDEYVDVSQLPGRTALLAMLISLSL